MGFINQLELRGTTSPSSRLFRDHAEQFIDLQVTVAAQRSLPKKLLRADIRSKNPCLDMVVYGDFLHGVPKGPIEMDDLGYPHFRKPPNMDLHEIYECSMCRDSFQ